MDIEVTSIEQKIERFISTLETMGGSAGNQRLREALGWQESTYDRIKRQLLEESRIVSGRGRGGSVALPTTAYAANKESTTSLEVREVSLPYLKTKAKADSPSRDKATTAPAAKTLTPRNGVVKKSDLYSSIWASCDELRGGMDASQYKDYVLFMLFIKYISDKYGNSDDFAPPVVIPPGASFKDMVALKGKDDIGDRINTQVIQKLIDANTKLARSDFPDFNDPNKLGEGSAMVERLGNLIAIFEKPELNFANNRADNDDLLGDAYEYLMRHFAQDSGKSKGQFYTPSEVSSVIAQVIGISYANTKASTTAYDPTCGSGSLLLKVAAEAGRQITLEGQEKDVTTAGLARMNMILHDFPSATILSGDTLVNPKFKDGEQLRAYDYVVANPPFSDKKWSTGLNPANDPYHRFTWGEPPAKQGDYAYLLHVIRSMKATTGKGAVILPHGVLFRGNAEAHIRRHLVRSGMLKGIIGLPANLFYGTGIPACILVLDKENASARKGIFMIDASKGFIKDGPKNRLREQDIHRIVDAFRRSADEPRYARMVPLDEIASDRNDYNLNLPRYIDSSEPEDLHDIDAHLNGGIPERDIDAFAADWQEMPALRHALFEAERPGYARLRKPMAEVRSIILAHPQFQQFRSKVETLFSKWQQAVMPLLTGVQPGDKPKALIVQVSETLLTTFHAAPLLDPYNIYQHLMDYWVGTMQDDAYLIAADGWMALPRRIVETDKKGNTKDKGWTCDLLPKPYIVARYFADEQAELDAKQAELESISSQIAELEEEQGGEDGAFTGFDKINAAQVKDRLAEIGADPDSADERAVLKQWQQLSACEAALKKTVKTLEVELDQHAHDHYFTLSEAEVKTLVVKDKWLARLQADVQQELERISQTLAQRIRELAERYETPLPKLEDGVAALSAKVEAHLKKMGAVWK
ncbi:putative type I restriction enzymeP M protein [Pandoraea communis]|uniref:site-specific DNA-methyltransferase (adenine-specific) n=1 Tax=Pandoraea communis TaxID=2508297 RepID=A0A5E4VDE5_9BURK|nr:class I SAM-dependent DNA methyltransferase [Pandoraea communis]VVE10242.1 putative type I restriction enzymeP M protein [Pandoraea communis]